MRPVHHKNELTWNSNIKWSNMLISYFEHPTRAEVWLKKIAHEKDSLCSTNASNIEMCIFNYMYVQNSNACMCVWSYEFLFGFVMRKYFIRKIYAESNEIAFVLLIHLIKQRTFFFIGPFVCCYVHSTVFIQKLIAHIRIVITYCNEIQQQTFYRQNTSTENMCAYW